MIEQSSGVSGNLILPEVLVNQGNQTLWMRLVFWLDTEIEGAVLGTFDSKGRFLESDGKQVAQIRIARIEDVYPLPMPK